MRQKTRKLVVTFPSTTAALQAEQLFVSAEIQGRMIPVPRQISAGCGLAWMSPPEEKEQILQILDANQVMTEACQEVML